MLTRNEWHNIFKMQKTKRNKKNNKTKNLLNKNIVPGKYITEIEGETVSRQGKDKGAFKPVTTKPAIQKMLEGLI